MTRLAGRRLMASVLPKTAGRRGGAGRFVWPLLTLLLGFGVGLLWPILKRPPLVLGQDAVVSGVPLDSANVRLVPQAGGFIDIRPASRNATRLLIFYPGGLVRPQAYEWIGRALAQEGIRTVIPVFPLDFAVLDKNRADRLLNFLQAQGNSFGRVYLAGHSLGGAMAASYAKTNAGKLAGLILLGAYPAGGDDLSKLNLRVLDLAAERDGAATLAEVRDGLQRLPTETQLTVIPGSVHAFFGRYGPQRGDGTPTIVRARAEEQIIAALSAFVR